MTSICFPLVFRPPPGQSAGDGTEFGVLAEFGVLGWNGLGWNLRKAPETLLEKKCCETLNKDLPRKDPICSERIAPTCDRIVGGFCDHDRIRRDLLANDVCSESACGRQQHQ